MSKKIRKDVLIYTSVGSVASLLFIANSLKLANFISGGYPYDIFPYLLILVALGVVAALISGFGFFMALFHKCDS